jgi:hypothetical protein
MQLSQPVLTSKKKKVACALQPLGYIASEEYDFSTAK